MKVVGRDMFVGIWALMVAWMSVTVWEKKEGNGNGAERVDIGEVWRRFPKFVIGFFVASIFTTILIASVAPKVGSAYSKDALGVIKTLGDGLKVLGSGELTRPIQVQANLFSKSAQEKIQAAGGSAQIIGAGK
jgi:ribosomal protein L15